MFYTGLPGGGRNLPPLELNDLTPLLMKAKGIAHGGTMSGASAPSRNNQLPYVLLPLTLSHRIRLKAYTAGAMEPIEYYLENTNIEPGILEICLFEMPPPRELLNEKYRDNLMPQLMADALKTHASDTPAIARFGRRAVVMLQTVSPQTILTFVALMPHIWPELATTEPKFNPKIFHALGTRNYQDWVQLMREWAEPLIEKARQEQREYEIDNCFQFLSTNERGLIENKLNTTRNALRVTLMEYSRIKRQEVELLRQERDIALNGENFTETAAYWKRKKEIYNIEPYGMEGLRMTIVTPVINYDEDELHMFLQASRENGFNRDQRTQAFYRRLFIDRTHQLRFGASLTLNLTEGSIDRASQNEFPKDMHAMWNPHIYHYVCFGDNERLIMDSAMSRNFETTIELIVSSVGNLNFADEAVMSRFREGLLSETAACIKDLATGKWMTPRQLYEMEEES